MCQLIESIKVQNRQLQNIRYHDERFNLTRKELFGINDRARLSELIHLPQHINSSVYKCRIIYSESIHSIEFQPYTPKTISSLKIVHSDDIDYRYKYADRTVFSGLLENIEEDDMLIIKNGLVTDTSYANIVFYDGSKWITPESYLLNGCMRRFLLDTKQITEQKIAINDIRNFKTARLINAMLGLEDGLPLSVDKIHF
jgi:4-amino-4-deoxychorismate lyase